MPAPKIERDGAMSRIYRRIDRTRAAWRALDVLGGAVRTLLVLGAALLVGFLAARLDLPPAVWLLYALAMLAGATYMVARHIVYPLARPMSDEMVARHLEGTDPELDNRAINAVLLYEEEFDDPLTDRMVASQLGDTAGRLQSRPARPSDERGRLLRLGAAALGVTALLVAAIALFPEQRSLTWQRLLHAYSRTARIALTELKVLPGDTECLQGGSLAVEARVGGVLPGSATVHWRTGEDIEGSNDMHFDGSAFAYEFSNVQQDFTYRVRAGDAESAEFKVTVHPRPAVQAISLAYTLPEYTGLAERTDKAAGGDIHAPPATAVKFAVTTDRPVVRGEIVVIYPPAEDDGEPLVETIPLKVTGDGTALRGRLDVKASGTYEIKVASAEGFPNIPVVRRIVAEDRAPHVSIAEPAKDVTVAPDGKLRLVAAAQDDFNVRRLQLVVQREAGLDWETAQHWDCEGENRLLRRQAELDVAQMGLKVGSLLAYYVEAGDGRADEGVGRSRTYHLRVASAEQAARSPEEEREALRAVVRLLIKLQKENAARTRDLNAWAGGHEELEDAGVAAWDDFRGRGARMVAAEEAIVERADTASRSEPAGERSSLAEALGRLAAGPMTAAVRLLSDLSSTSAADDVPARSRAAEQKQEEIVSMLERLLDNPAAVLASLLKDEDATEELADQMEDLNDTRQLAEKMLRQLKDFAEAQREVIELTNQLGEKPVDDFTDEDEQKLNDIVETEKEWARIFQEMATDLSKLPPQDHSLSNQAKELLEVYSEVQQAAEEAERKAIELAVPHEQAGTELAEEIETNIEKWLMEDKDSQQWKMEDPIEDYETPLTELPDELQDLIGELVEDEEDMEEQFDDATSGWMDSLDKGAGWDTTDGPISNMSAKGVTGNRLPNTSEIGGRAGEGRTGKSSGQFVEEEATGKGGRQTPSRLTADPFEAGWVKDSSGEAPTGASGGGKVSGQGAEGFQGPVPPPLQQQLKRLAVQQQGLIDKAKRLDYGLKKYRHPRGKLPETIELMEAIQDSLEQGEISTFVNYNRIVLSDLRDVKETSELQKQVWRDRTAPLPKELRDEIASARNERMPEQYRELIRSYFRSLAGEGAAEP